MQFEKQEYQEKCVANILTILAECDVRENDFGDLPRALKDFSAAEKHAEFAVANKNRLDVLMETGTGKTFTYLKTILEINRQFGKNKFIIVVPRTAIKLGVIQNIKMTDNYFFNEYKKHLSHINYPDDGIGKVIQDFLMSDDLSILITTNSAFNSQKNKINQRQERFFEAGSIWDGIKEKNPVIIIDEPHLLKGTETQKGLGKLDNCLQIRFGATFPGGEELRLSNVAYTLDSISAFNEYLVKRIRVNTIFARDETTPVSLQAIDSAKKTYRIVYDINEIVYEKELRKGDDIGAITGLPGYSGVTATKINRKEVSLSNREVLAIRQSYRLGDEEIRIMVRNTIRKHFEKEEALFAKNIKTLSLFFIPEIRDFRASEQNPTPAIKIIFEEEYKKIRKEFLKNADSPAYKDYLKKDLGADGDLRVHGGYFSGDKGSKDEKEAKGINIILNEKEKLLSFDTPLRFIFSVWALQEGWDNPNIFNICKLSATAGDISRRQQVGRGLRIAVNQGGKRLTYQHLGEEEHDFYDINTLDMVVSAQEKEFIRNIQREIKNASFSFVGDTLTLADLTAKGIENGTAAAFYTALRANGIIDKKGTVLFSIHDFTKNNRDKLSGDITEEDYKKILRVFTDNKQPVVDGKRGPQNVTVKPDKWQDFKNLWEAINKKAEIVYKGIREDDIIRTIAGQFGKADVPPVAIKVYSQTYNTQQDKVVENKQETQGDLHFFRSHKLADFLDFFVKKEKLPMAFMLKLLGKLDKQKIQNNPGKAQKLLLSLIEDTIHGAIIRNISYRFSQTTIYPNSLQNERGEGKKHLPHTQLGRHFSHEDVPAHLLYDTICYDSQIEKEIQAKDPAEANWFTNGVTNKVTVRVFAKLPKINIPTPYKTYNPDFAYLIEKQDGKVLFLVVEAKGYERAESISDAERNKIRYAEEFFAALQAQMPQIQVHYTTRINRQDLADLLTDIV